MIAKFEGLTYIFVEECELIYALIKLVSIISF